MGRVVIAASRRALAVLVLLVAALVTVWVALFKVWYPGGVYSFPVRRPGPVPHSACTHMICTGVRPGWTIPVAIAIALIGLIVAVLLYTPRRGRGERRAVDVRGPKRVSF